jgi:SAM-dependent methyltransferase
MRDAMESGPGGSSSSDEVTYDLALLERSRARWEHRAGLRAVYGEIYRAMAAAAAPGPALELGSGCGTMRDFLPDVVTSDVRATPYASLAASAYAIEAAPGGPWSTIYLLDVLHHLRDPFAFFGSAARALRAGGRVVICDPAATPLGRWFYRLCHHEPIQPARILPPYVFPPDSAQGDFANMGMTWALFHRDFTPVSERLRALGLRAHRPRFRDLLAYPATGGFSGPALLPAAVLRGVVGLERHLPNFLLRGIGLRMVVVLEKSAPATGRPGPAHDTGADKTAPRHTEVP